MQINFTVFLSLELLKLYLDTGLGVIKKLKYEGAKPLKILKTINRILNSILNFTGSQCKSTIHQSRSLEFVRVGGETIQPSSSVCNLGVILDPSADMEDYIKKICKTCHFHLTNISKIRTYLDRESTEAIIHAFVFTNLDYCNAILYGLPKVPFNRLQLGSE